MDYTVWVRHFESNADVQRASSAEVDRSVGSPLTRRTRRTRQAFVHSFQRFELGESGDGEHLLAKAARAGDAQYTRALTLLVAEEQRHAELFGRGLHHLGGSSLARHWSDTAFTALRRACGLRTELGLFLVAESVATEYFTALATDHRAALRACGRRPVGYAWRAVRHLRDQLDLALTGEPRLLGPLPVLARVA